jgi:hypothetical protein
MHGRNRSGILQQALSLLGCIWCLQAPVLFAEESSEVERLVAALLGDTPLVEDLRSLTDEVGGRPTGSAANLRSVEWALERFRQAGVAAGKEAFPMPVLWLERAASAEIRSGSTEIRFAPRVAAMPFSTAAPTPDGVEAPLVDGGFGGDEDFARLGDQLSGAFILIETRELVDVPGLFKEYSDAAAIEGRAFATGAAGVVYMGSRPRNLLYRHNASRGSENRHPMLVMERDGAKRALRLLRAGRELWLRATIDIDSGGPYESYNVVAEIKGWQEPEEFVVIGAHLDSWGLGTGSLDNGCNVALVIDVARQIRRLGLQPRRTIRFALFNGEEQGLHGSWGYTRSHADELDRHVMASSYDIGSGRITGFFTNGREELVEAVDRALTVVAGLGPFTNVNAPIVGTDNYDFMMQGVANLVANQKSANYGPNYHARSDTFDKVDQHQLRLNAAVAAAVTYGLAEMDATWSRHRRRDIEQLIESTDLGDQMKMFFGLWEAWQNGTRGRAE